MKELEEKARILNTSHRIRGKLYENVAEVINWNKTNEQTNK